jgi:hypothetical protein
MTASNSTRAAPRGQIQQPHGEGGDTASTGHLHFDRRARLWLEHSPDGGLQPYRDGAEPPEGRGH